MGKFLNTQYYDTVDSLVKMNEDLVQNPFYLYNDKKEEIIIKFLALRCNWFA